MGILDMLFGSGQKTTTTSPNFGPFEPLAQDLSQLSQFLISRPNVPYMGPQIAAPSPAYQAGMGRVCEIGMPPTERIDSPMRAPQQRAANGGALQGGLGQAMRDQSLRLAPGFNGGTGGNMPFRPPMAQPMPYPMMPKPGYPDVMAPMNPNFQPPRPPMGPLARLPRQPYDEGRADYFRRMAQNRRDVMGR